MLYEECANIKKLIFEQKIGVGKILHYSWKKSPVLPKAAFIIYLFDQKYSNNVKYYCYLKELF